MRRVARAVAVAALITGLSAGCTKPPTTDIARPSPGPSRTAGATPGPGPEREPTNQPPTRTASAAPTFGEQQAVSCAGYPSGDQVIAFLRRTLGQLPSNVPVTVHTGPLCSGTWQYTVLTVPNQDPLQVVTRGQPTALQLVTAGTDVCSVSVRATAPAGIRAVTKCT
jgi:hypothetical protein